MLLWRRPLQQPTRGRANRAVGSQSTDREALLALYWSSGGPRWKRNHGWADNDEDLSTWHGVTLDEKGRVSRLDLNRNQLDGEGEIEGEGNNHNMVGDVRV